MFLIRSFRSRGIFYFTKPQDSGLPIHGKCKYLIIMNFFRNNIGTVLVAFLLYEPIFGDITCRMRLNDDCPARVWQDQYRCIMAQNTLSMIMDCITVRQDSSENLRCRPQDNNFDVGEEIYERRVINGVLNLCIIPRAVLIHGPPTLPRYWPASMAGALKACPAHDPRFLICLCSLNVHPEQMVEFAQNFMSDKNQVFGCRRQAPAPKVPRELLELPMYNSSIMESRLEVSAYWSRRSFCGGYKKRF